MAIAYRNSLGSNNAGGGLSITVNMPSGIVDGDVLIMSVVGNSTTPPTPPTGWTSFHPTGFSGILCFRIASSEPASYILNYVTSAKVTAVVIALSGADTTIPSVSPTSGFNSHGQINGSSSTITAPALGTWTSINGISVYIGHTLTGTTAAAPTNYTLAAQSAGSGGGAGSRSTSGVSYRSLSAVTTIGSLTAIYGAAAANVGYSIFIKEAVVVPSRTPRPTSIGHPFII